MRRDALAIGLAATVVAAFAGAASAGVAPRPVEATGGDISLGQRIAQRHCGGCHAVAAGNSPLADAPPFRNLHRRYPAGGLAQLLDEGMLPEQHPAEEGARQGHPRMPTAKLDLDEVAALTAYLRSLEPPR